MHVYHSLPQGWTLKKTVDLQNDKKKALLVNGCATVVAVLMAAVMHCFVPIQTLFSGSDELSQYLIRMGILLGGMLVYLVLHEATHGLTMKACGAKNLSFGFTGLYAYCGSKTDYFDRFTYFLTALSPLIVWGAVFAALQLTLPGEWFWIVWLWQITNVSGAAGDVYIVLYLSRLDRPFLVHDDGVVMHVALQEEA